MRQCFILLLVILHHVVVAKERPIPVEQFVQNTFSLSEVMLHDVINPPAASRFYAYCMLGAFQAIHQVEKYPIDLPAMLRVPPSFIVNTPPACVSKDFVATYTMLEVGRQLIPSGHLLENVQKQVIQDFKKRYHYTAQCLEQNIAYATQVATQVAAYSRTDGYGKLSTMARYAPAAGNGYWYPTPPEYMSAVEPHWRTIRPFFLDSAHQFPPQAAAPFSIAKNAPFSKLMHEVYDVSKGMTSEQRAIAAFWDCNPFAVQYSGHAAMGLKKISPGGHWIGITGIACVAASASIEKTVFAHTFVALTLHDGFISCWDEKFRSDRIRPESVITKYIDPEWRPMLQTPPFPEYTSGHSVISTATAEVLTFVFGDGFKFTDTSEEYFGLPARHFNSFRHAADEAAISRLYGGIHFRDAIENGQDQGRKIGQFIIDKIQRTNTP